MNCASRAFDPAEIDRRPSGRPDLLNRRLRTHLADELLQFLLLHPRVQRLPDNEPADGADPLPQCAEVGGVTFDDLLSYPASQRLTLLARRVHDLPTPHWI